MEQLKLRVWNERAQREQDGTLLVPKPISVDLDEDDDEPPSQKSPGKPIVIKGDEEIEEVALDVWSNLKDVDLQPAGLRCSLLPHQVCGVRWMVRQEQIASRTSGILADDMGLVCLFSLTPY
jgi:SNF2 family DNA or RNA helicase